MVSNLFQITQYIGQLFLYGFLEGGAIVILVIIPSIVLVGLLIGIYFSTYLYVLYEHTRRSRADAQFTPVSRGKAFLIGLTFLITMIILVIIIGNISWWFVSSSEPERLQIHEIEDPNWTGTISP